MIRKIDANKTTNMREETYSDEKNEQKKGS